MGYIELEEIEFELNKENIKNELVTIILYNRKDYFGYQFRYIWITLYLRYIYPNRSDIESYFKEYMEQFKKLYKNEFSILLVLLKNRKKIVDYSLLAQLLNELDEIFEQQYKIHSNCFDTYFEHLEQRSFNNYNYKFNPLEINHYEVNNKAQKVIKKDR